MSNGGKIGKECWYFKCVAVKKVQVCVPVFKPVSCCVSSCGALSPTNNVSDAVLWSQLPHRLTPFLHVSPNLSASRIDF